jgi:hypothetical protein
LKVDLMHLFGIRKSLKQAGSPSGSWRKSSFSSYTGNCVEVADGAEGTIRVRDSRNPGPVLAFSAAKWDAFVGAIREDPNRGLRG